MALRTIKKVNTRMKFLYRKSSLGENCKTATCEQSYYVLQRLYKCILEHWTFHQTQITKASTNLLNFPPTHHLGVFEFERMGWLPVSHMVQQIKELHMYKALQQTAPNFLNFNIIQNQHRHKQDTTSFLFIHSTHSLNFWAENIFITQVSQVYNVVRVGTVYVCQLSQQIISVLLKAQKKIIFINVRYALH